MRTSLRTTPDACSTGVPSRTHRKFSSLLFDPQDHKLIQLVNAFVEARAQNNALRQPEAGLHPHGIIEMASSHGLRLASAVIVLLESWRLAAPTRPAGSAVCTGTKCCIPRHSSLAKQYRPRLGR